MWIKAGIRKIGQTERMPGEPLHLDLTHSSIPCAARHQLVLQSWALLESEEYFTIRTDHDPKPLREVLEMKGGGRLGWSYLESGPRSYLVRIERKA